jgi:hypothetical protein
MVPASAHNGSSSIYTQLMYTSSSIRPFKKVVFTSILYKSQPKTDAIDVMDLIVVYLATRAKVSS